MDKVKLVIWDLDNTIWQGVLIEDKEVYLSNGIKEIIEGLDNRGILQSISSKNDYSQAMEQLKLFKLDQYFLYPQINWNAKSLNIEQIIKKINISSDTVVFIDDQIFEREEVSYSIPDIRCIDAVEISHLLEKEEMNPDFITQDSSKRRLMYQSQFAYEEEETTFQGTKEVFLAGLNMTIHIQQAKKEDLLRAAELTIRTHQLNSTGYTYSQDELEQFMVQEEYYLLSVGLMDKFGDYGKIGLILIQELEDTWIIKLLITSCRVISRGIGTALLGLIVNKALKKNKKLLAEFVPTDKNRIMAITYSMLGFTLESKEDEKEILICNRNKQWNIPNYFCMKEEF